MIPVRKREPATNETELVVNVFHRRAQVSIDTRTHASVDHANNNWRNNRSERGELARRRTNRIEGMMIEKNEVATVTFTQRNTCDLIKCESSFFVAKRVDVIVLLRGRMQQCMRTRGSENKCIFFNRKTTPSVF